MGMSLISEKSICANPGPKKSPAGAVPNAPGIPGWPFAGFTACAGKENALKFR